MRPFAYRAPTTVAEAVALLDGEDGRARPLAGGTDLLVQLRRRQLEVDLVVDVKRIPELNVLVLDPVSGLTVGAAVTCARLCEHPGLREAYPGLVDAVSTIGGAAIQERATLGGNLCNATPSGDSIPALIVLGATCTVAGPGPRRAVPAEAFCTAPGMSVLGRGEVLVSIHLPAPTPNSGASYLRFTPRGEMDLAVAGAGAWIRLSEDRSRIVDARVALSAVAPTPLLVQASGEALIDQSPTEATFVQAAMHAQEAARPISDVRGTGAQRRHLVGVLVKRALRVALDRALERSEG
jgi:carbon-monoxide dehydrogenase medium subunit